MQTAPPFLARLRLLLAVTLLTVVAASGLVLTGTARAADTYPDVNPGATGPRVSAIQHLLTSRGIATPVTGSYDQRTTANVVAFQRSQHILDNGIAGPQTLSRLVSVQQYTANNDAVRAVQRLLIGHGARLDVDGSFGDMTLAAVKNFQSSKKLPVDGSVGPQTWTALFQADHGGTPPTTTQPPSHGTGRTLVPMNQMLTPVAFRDANCGPTSVTMLLVASGKPPAGYRGPNDYVDAINGVRGEITQRDAYWPATSTYQLQPLFAKRGIAARNVGYDTTLAEVRGGKMAMFHGNWSKLPWIVDDGQVHSHWMAMVGYDPTKGYRVLDPSQGQEHWMSRDDARAYAFNNAGRENDQIVVG